MSLKNYSPLDLKSATVLITGGSTGIGLGLAERFLSAGSTVIVTGRRQEVLDEAKSKLPALHTHVNDVSKAEEREALAAWAIKEFPKLNVLVNNAGIQRLTPLVEDTDWASRQLEIAINFEAPVHLAHLLTPHLKTQPEAAIINITSGLGFIPFAKGPVYGATKAAMHSFTMAIRPHYANTNIHIIEIAPPAVKTNFHPDFGEDLDEFCDHAFQRFTAGEPEIGFRMSEEARNASRQELNQRFEGMKKMMEGYPLY